MNSTVQVIRGTLRKAINEYGEIDAIYLSTFDGNPICAVSKKKRDTAEFGIVSSVMVKLGILGAQTLDKGELEVVYIKGKNGYVFIRNIDKDVVMTISTSKDAPIGLLHNIEDLAQKISEVLNVGQAETPLDAASKQLAEITE
jgi:predicted regulator of Ras-like GTPase activity (Roadblock/LC7/MglB family)